MVKGKCGIHDVHYFVDSGSSISIVSHRFVKRLNLLKLLSPTEISLQSFTHHRIPAHGTIDLVVNIAGITASHTFVVTDFLDTDFLIGMDFMYHNNITLDIGSQLFISPNGSARFFNKPLDVPRTMKIRCKQNITVPPNSRQFIRGTLPAGVKSNY